MLVRESISFQRKENPYSSIGVGQYSKNVVRNKVKQLTSNLSEDEIEGIEMYMIQYANEIGSGFDVYLSQKAQINLYFFIKLLGKKRIKIKGFNPEDYYSNTRQSYHEAWDYAFDKIISPLLDKGWELFTEGSNGSYNEYILFKYD